MNRIKKVALAGATGNLGPAILEQLLQHAFEVTVLTRGPSAAHVFPPSVQVNPVGYASRDSLVSALRGQDAVVSAMAPTALDHQLLLIDAAAAAGVRRFIPSEFGSDTTNPATAALPIYRGKVAAQQVLRDKTAAGTGFTYTLICTGSFLDWGVSRGFMIVRDKRITLYDGGNGVFSTTTLRTAGRTVCGVLSHPGETANRVVRVQDTATTLNRLLAMGKRASGPEGWSTEVVSVEAVLEKAWAEFRRGRTDLETMYGFIPAAVWGQGYGGYFRETDNKLLGIEEMTDDEVQAVVDRAAG